MTLDEAIQHARDVARAGCAECNLEHGQLAEWLEELRDRRQNKPVKTERLLTNADRIRQMTDEEELLSAIGTGGERR